MTRNRRQWLPKAIACYRAQTYPNRELLIVADGENVIDLIPENDSSIRFFQIEEGRNVGEKRNFGSFHARGDFICSWDDDDYSAPGRLDDQVLRLLHSGKSVLRYKDMLFTDGARWWRYVGTGTLGTSLMYRRSFAIEHPFPPRRIGEDWRFAQNAADRGQLVTVEAGDLMVATVHPGNTSKRALDEAYKELPDFAGIPSFP